MRIEVRRYPGKARTQIDLDGPTTSVRYAVGALNEALFTPIGCQPESTSVLRNGVSIRRLNGLDTTLRPGDLLTILRTVSGGGNAVIERTFRGISARAAVHYLTGIGGEHVDDDTVEGEGWRAHVSDSQVSIGPTLELTEVTVRIEGEPDVAESVMETFAAKAVRAGG